MRAKAGAGGRLLMALEPVDLDGWEALRLSNQRLAVTATPQPGGRVMSLVFDGEELLFRMPELLGRALDVASSPDVRARKRELGWLHWGGDKTWLSPQERWSDALPFLDLDSGRYRAREVGGALALASPVCRETGAQLERRVALPEPTRIRVEHRLANRGDAPIERGIWGVTQVRGPGTAVLPIAARSRFPGGVKPYPNEGRSPRILERMVRRQDGLARIRCGQTETFKYGTDSRAGWILGLLDRGPGRRLAFLKSFTADAQARYAHAACVEVYDSDRHPYFELETHAPLRRLVPGETQHFVETWSLGWIGADAGAAALRAWVEAERKAAAG